MDCFRSLLAKERALVAIAVLLDGREAAVYLENDALNGDRLKDAATQLALSSPEIRMPFAGTLLRQALGEMDLM